MTDFSDSHRDIQAASFAGLRDVADELGKDITSLFDAAGIDPELIENANGLIPFGDFCLLLKHRAAIRQVPDFDQRVA